MFYDKEIAIYTKTTVTDSEGWSKISESISADTFFGNVNFSRLDKVQEDYGIKESVDMTITTSTGIDLETIIGYEDRLYKVIKAIPFDTHYLLIATKWTSKSSTLISL